VRLALKILGGVALLLMLAVAGLAVSLYLDAATSEHPVGFQRVTVHDPDDKPFTLAIWYPTDAKPGATLMGLSMQTIARNGNVSGRALPLIVISHGNNGTFASHSDTALALASAGFAVAAVMHTGDNAEDSSYVGTPRWLIDRPRHIRLAIDYMLKGWPARKQIDASRIGVFGFSAGGFTALVSVGGVPDFMQLTTHCKEQPEFACTLWKKLPSAVPASVWIHDPRIKAAVIAAPGFGFAFAPNGLSQVRAPLQLWNGTSDRNVPYPTNEAVIRALLPVQPEYHVVSGASHFTFIAPCPAWLFPLICGEPNGFDRKAFHRAFNLSVIGFFQEQLKAH
jgi:predicted dienelactone hydrolase